MNYPILETALAAIADAKREILRIDPTNETRKDLDQAFDSLEKASQSIKRLLHAE